MEDTAYKAIAIVGAGAVLPDASNVPAFWENIRRGRYSISEVSRDRWDPAYYYDPDPSAPDKSYSKIGGWVREYAWDPMKWHMPLPPRVTDAMDQAQKWAIAATREALEDYGYPKRPLDPDRIAVILGNAMAGEKHYLTALRVYFPEYTHELAEIASFAALPEEIRTNITRELHDRIGKHLPEITEDTMPGELSNCIAGRIANLYNFRGPNYVCDAACASAMAAMTSAVEGLIAHDFDAAVTGGIDRNMGASTFIKFCKIGALSGTGSRPYAEGADGFVMGEGAAIFLMKRLADAERDGDRIYAVLRGIGASSDGKGKGITAPNPVGQKLCIERAWQNAGLSPSTATLIEGHGTSTRVGDVVEAQSLAEVLASHHLPTHSIALGSVKSNIGHLKGAAGAAGLLKTVLAIQYKTLPPSVHCERPSPDIDFAHSPLYVNTELKEWTANGDFPLRAGVSAFGFGGTNFHLVLEEHIPRKLTGNGKKTVAVGAFPETHFNEASMSAKQSSSASVSFASSSPYSFAAKPPLRGALVIGAASDSLLIERLRTVMNDAKGGHVPALAPPDESDLHATERLAIDYVDAADLASKAAITLKAFAANQPAMWKALRSQGIFRGKGPAPKVAFLYTGQGSQYVNMLRPLCDAEPIISETFAEADRVMTPLLGKPLSKFIFVDQADASAVAKAEEDLRQTAITQPAVLAADLALTRLLAAYGITPDFTMGHSLGEYGALVASGALPFADALEAVSARGREMTRFSLADNGKMAAVFAPLQEIERILKTIDGYLVIANINSRSQAVIGGASKAIDQAMQVFQRAGYEITELPVSHAFHTSIVAPASDPLRRTLARLHLESPHIPIAANVNGEFYPTGPDVVPQMPDILAKQVASPVQFVKGLQTLFAAGARVFVEVGPKKALQGFAEDVLGDRGDMVSLFTNHPKFGDITSFNQALCGLYAAGLGQGKAVVFAGESASSRISAPASTEKTTTVAAAISADREGPLAAPQNGNHYSELGHFFADVLERGWQIYRGEKPAVRRDPVLISGAAIGLPGTEHIFDDENLARILRGDQFIDVIPSRLRSEMLDKHITRLVKSDNGGPTFETIHNVADVIKLAGRGGAFDLEKQFGVSADRVAALDRDTQLAIAVGIEALRDAGIPLVMRYKKTSKGTQLPDRWMLPDALRDDTGVIFASAFPGYDSYADEMRRYYADHSRREQLGLLESLLAKSTKSNGDSILDQEIERRAEELRDAVEKNPYVFDRRFLLRVLAMGHSQFAEFIGARGPNTQINAACASTAQAVALAEDWIHAGRCRRVIIVSADDITTDHLIDWFGAGFLASGAAATDEVVEEAATPFDRRRHGLIIGMGAAAMVIESADIVRERGMQAICELLGAATANSAFHATRLDVDHIGQVMEDLVARTEAQFGISRQQIAPRTVFVSHETYTPARGGSASAEVFALRRVFGAAADQIVIANTKGLTGHAMGTGIEDVIAVKTLETGIVPPVANFKEVDPELGTLNLSKGGVYPVEYALRLGAGFGSQISMTLLHWITTRDGVHRRPNALGYGYRIVDDDGWKSWLSRIAGDPCSDLEVVHRTLRVPDGGIGKPKVADRMQKEAAQKTPSPVLEATTLAPPRAKEAALAKPKSLSVQEGKKEETVAAPISAPPVAPLARMEEPATQGDPVKERILALVAEKTGYPIDMLALDLDLEADLGVDTVKQAEVMATIREAYGIARDDSIKLRDLPTLGHVIQFVHRRRPDLQAGERGARPAATPSASQPAAAAKQDVEIKPASLAPAATLAKVDDPVKERILALVVEKTGYPEDMLDLDLDLEADLGVDTVKQAEMFAAIREIYNIPRDENRKLRDYPTLAHVIRFVYEKRPDLVGKPQTMTSPASPAPAPGSPAVPLSVPIAQTTSADSANSEDPIKKKILAIVAEKTGYPEDMLDLDLDLEADLGVDTVKQAEMFAAVRAAYNIPRDETLKLRDFPTLAHVIKFAHERSAVNAPAVVVKDQPDSLEQKPLSVPSAATQPARPALASLDAANRIPRRVPVPILRPQLSFCKPTGVKLGPGSRVVLMPDKGGVAEALTKTLRAKGVEVLCLDPTRDDNALSSRLKEWMTAGSIHGVYWLAALDCEGDIRTLDLEAWHEAVQIRVKSLYITMRALYENVQHWDNFLITATRLGGLHGYDEAGAVAPLGGSVVGFAKAYKRERPDCLVKAIDFQQNRKPDEVADRLVAETLRDPAAVEIGYTGDDRWTIGLEEQPAADGQPGLVLDKNSVLVITGAAGSIVSAITADLAAASGGTFYLLDLVREPDANNPDLKRFVTDREGLKRDLFCRIQARGERATPALVEKELAQLERAQAAQSAIDAVRAAGGTAHYFSVNLTDAEAVGRIIAKVREQVGHIDVLLHAAGIDRSHSLADKDPKEFDTVFDVKSDGFFNLLHAIGDMPLRSTVAFSSIAGRFGNAGQTDYSAANDLLCKITSSFRTTRPLIRGIAIDWTAWAGIGMATRGSIPRIMETAGIDMLPPEAGISVVRRELTAGATRGEVVIGQRLGVLANEWDATGGIDIAEAESALKSSSRNGPMLGKIVSTTLSDGCFLETTLDPRIQPFLHDHQIDGTPVLPGVMGIEAFAEAAQCLLPEWHVESIADIAFLAPFKFYRSEPRTLRMKTRVHPRGDRLLAECQLIGERALPNQTEPQRTTHFTGRVWLTKEPAARPIVRVPIAAAGTAIDARDIYSLYFHGPAYRVLDRAWWDGKQMIGRFAENLPANHHPSGLTTIICPRLIELCFQTAGVWELGVRGRMGLPRSIQEVLILRDPNLAEDRLFAVVTPNSDQETFDAEVQDLKGNCYLRLTGYGTVALSGGMDADALKKLQMMMSNEVVLAA